jgi:hypothetical protein
MSLDSIELLAKTLDADLVVRLAWRGESLDRLRDSRHAALVETTVRRLERNGWLVLPEVSFSIWGERGSIDVLASHPATQTLLVVEVKSAIGDVQELLSTLDRKARLGPIVGRQRGWEVRRVCRLLVVGEGATNRRRVREHAATFQAALPDRGAAVGAQLRHPTRAISGLRFLPFTRPVGMKRLRGPSRASVAKPSRTK